MPTNNIATYIKNLGKSVAFSTMDHIKEHSEDTSSFVETNQELFTDIYTNIKNYKVTLGRVDKFIKGSKLYEAAELGIQTTFESIKTGELYSKKREDRITQRALGSMGDFGGDDLDLGDLDLGDIDTELGDWDFDDEDLDIGDGDRYLASETDRSVGAAADAISETIAESAKYTAHTQKISTNLLYSQSVINTKTVNDGFAKVHETMQSIANAQLEAMKVADQNNQAFYNAALQLDRDRNEMLAEMLKIQRTANGITDNKNKEKEDLSFTGITDAAGMPDLKRYFKAIAANMKNQAGMLGAMGDMFGDDSNPFLTFAANPLKFISDSVVKYIIPTTVDTAMESLDKTITGFFGSMIARFNKWGKDDDASPIAKFLGNIFGLKNTLKTSIDTSNYTKGPVPFDGITRKSIVEVIPFYLRQIAAATTGQEEVVYDFKSGKFTKLKTVKDNFKSIKEGAVRSGTSDIREQAYKFLRNDSHVRFDSYDQEERFYNDFDKMMTYIFDNGGYLNTRADRTSLSQKMGVDETNLRIFLDSIWPNINRGTRMQMASNVMNARNNMTRNLMDLEESGDSIFQQKFNESDKYALHVYDEKGFIKDNRTKSPLLITTDNKGHNLFFYLQETLRELMWQRANWMQQTPRYGRAGNQPGRSIEDIAVPSQQTENQRRRDQRDRTNRENFARRVEELRTRYPDGFDMAELSADERSTFYALKNDIEFHNKNELRKAFNQSGYGEIVSWYDKINTYGKGTEADKKWEDLNEMVGNTKGIFNQLRKAEGIRGKLGVLKIRSSNMRDDAVNFIADTITKADMALYKLIFGDDKEIKDEDGNPYHGFLDAMIGKMQDSFTRFNLWLDDKILKPLKDKLGIESMGDIPKKILGWFGIDVDFDNAKQNAKEKFQNFIEPFKESVKEAGGAAFEFIKESLDSVADAIGLNGFLDKAKDFFSTPPSEESTTEEDIADRTQAILEEMQNANDNLEDIVDAVRESSTVNAEGTPERRVINGIRRETRAGQESNREQPAGETENREQPAGERVRRRTGIIESAAEQIERHTRRRVARAGFIRRESREGEETPQQHAYGARFVEKSGITAISKGEMIIPANLNPFNPDREKVDIDKQAADEENIIQRVKRGEPIKKRAEGTAHIARTVEGGKDPFGKQMLDTLFSGAKALGEGLFGNTGMKDSEFRKNLSKVTGSMKENAPALFGGGVVGGAVSLLTGMFGGPLLGAAVGAAVNLTRKSKSMQDLLFGEVLKDDEGNEVLDDEGKVKRAQGLISEKIQKIAPTIAKFGVVGGLAGFLTPLGPIGGLMVGSALGYAKTNEEISKALFGDGADPNSGLFSQNRKEWLKQKLPAAAVGAVGTMLLGPFGLVGNAAVGAGLGLITTTDEFKDVMFGPETMGPDGKMTRNGGIVGSIRKSVVEPLKDMAIDLKDKGIEWIKKDIIEPVTRAIDPIANQAKLMMQGMFDRVTDTLNGIFKKVLGDPLDVFIQRRLIEPMTKIVGGVFKAAMKPGAWLLSRPSAAIGAFGDSLRSRQVKRGTASYMTAQERLDWREQKHLNRFGKDDFYGRDEMLAQLDSRSLDGLFDTVKTLYNRDDEAAYASDIRDASAEIVRGLHGTFTHREADRIKAKLLAARRDDGSLNAIDSIIDNSNLTEVQKAYQKDDIKKKWNKMRDSIVARHNSRDAMDELSKKFEENGITGIDFNDKRSLRDLYKALDKERDARALASAKGEEPVLQTSEQIRDRVDRLIESGNTTNKILEQIRVGDNKYNKGKSNPIFKDIDYSRSEGAPTVQEQEEEAAGGPLHPLVQDTMNVVNRLTGAITSAGAGAASAAVSVENEEEEEEAVKYVNTDYGVLKYIRSNDGGYVLADTPENNAIQRQLEESRNIQRGMLSHLSNISTGFSSFLKNFFIGNKETDQKPWWQKLLTGIGVIGAVSMALAPVIDWLKETFGIDEKVSAVKKAVKDFTSKPTEQGGLGMSGEYGEESVGGTLVAAAGRLFIRGKGSAQGMLDRIPFLRNSNMAQGAARSIDHVRDLSLDGVRVARVAVTSRVFGRQNTEAIADTLVRLSERGLTIQDFAREVAAGRINLTNAAELGYDVNIVRAVQENGDNAVAALTRATREPGVIRSAAAKLGKGARFVGDLFKGLGESTATMSRAIARSAVDNLSASRLGQGISRTARAIGDSAAFNVARAIPEGIYGMAKFGASVAPDAVRAIGRGAAEFTGNLGSAARSAIVNRAAWNGNRADLVTNRMRDLATARPIANPVGQVFRAGQVMRARTAQGAESLVVKVVDKLASIFRGIASRIPSNAAEGISKFIGELGEAIVKHAGNAAKGVAKAGSKLAGFLTTGGVLGVVDAGASFVSGYQEAASIFSVIEGAPMDDGTTVQLTDGMKIVGGILRTLANIITFGLVPEKLVVNLALKYIAPPLGFDTSTIEAMRTASKKFLDSENEKSGKSLSIEQYNFEHGQKSIFKKMGDSLLATSTMKVIKEGIIPTVKGMAGKAFDFMKDFGPKLIDMLGYTVNVVASSIRLAADVHNENDQAWEDATAIDKNDPLYSLKKMVFYGARGIMLLPGIVIRLTTKLGGWFKDHAGDFGSVFKGLGGDIGAIVDTAVNGGAFAIAKIWTAKDDDTETSGGLGFGALRFVGKTATRLLMTIPAMVTSITQGVVPAVTGFVSGFFNIAKDTVSMTKSTVTKFFSGDAAGAIGDIVARTEQANQSDNPAMGISIVLSNLASAAIGVFATPITAFTAVTGALNWGLDKLGIGDPEHLANLRNASDPFGSLKKLWTTVSTGEKDPNKPFSGLEKAGEFIWKLMNTPVILVTNTVNMIADSLSSVKDKILDKFAAIKETVGKIVNPLLKLLGLDEWFDLKETDKKEVERLNKLYPESGQGGEGADTSGVPEKKFYQKDPKYANVTFNTPIDTVKQTIGDSGCAPVVAANLINRIRGTEVDVKDAASYAVNNGYKVPNQGTKPEYFGDIMNKYDIEPEYMRDNNARIIKTLKDGRPVILLGNSTGVPGTPFTHDSHYVIATGVDNFGNISIDDPLNKKAIVKYNASKILSATRVGITGASRSLTNYNPKFVKGTGIGGTEVDYVNQDLGKWTDIDPAVFDSIIAKSGSNGVFVGMGKVFVEAGKQSGLDPRYIFAHACLETGYGTSDIVRKKHNCFGIGAFDSDPYNKAHKFTSVKDGIIEGAKWIKKHYYDKGHKSLALMHKAGYATDPGWPRKIANIMARVNNISANGNYSEVAGGSTSGGDLISTSASTSFWSGLTSGMVGIGKALYGDLWTMVSGDDTSNGVEDSTSTGAAGSIAVADASGSSDKFFADTLTGSKITSKYGENRGNGKRHGGIDYAAPGGTPIYSPVSGKVVTNSFEGKGFGNYVVVQDAKGYKHYFGHMNKKSPLGIGTEVKRGDQVGTVGTTGHSTGNHLHYEIRPANGYSGSGIDPNRYFAENGLGRGPQKHIEYNAPLTAKSTNKGEGSGTDKEFIAKLAMAIIEVLNIIAGNTDKLSQIVELLTQYTGAKIDTSTLKDTKNNTKAVGDALLKALGTTGGTAKNPRVNADEDTQLTQSSRYLVETMRKIAAS